MDLRYSEADDGFRAELRAWLDATLPALAPAPPRDAWTERRKWDTDWQRRLFDAGYAGLHWPARVRRARRVADRAADLLRGDHAGHGAVRRRELRRHAARGSDAHRRGHRRAEGRAPAADPARRRGVVPGLLGAGARAPTSRRCAHAPIATATTTCSTARRSGARSARSPTSASSSCAPIPTRRSTRASRG